MWVAFNAKSAVGSSPKRFVAFASIDSGVGRIIPTKMKINTPIPNHLKSVVLAKPPLLLLFESLISTPNVAQNKIKINRAH